ncbi:MAG TPA: phosphoribosyltransferase family protein [Flavobacteriaceae bacterium]|nr:phosphoribosyltransferase family protein [Flavobacteriaceae bacterium]
MLKLYDLEFVPLIPQAEIAAAVQKISDSILKDFHDEIPIFVGILNGSFMFISDLVKQYPGKCEVDFVKMKSYVGTESTGKIKEIIGLGNPNGKPLIIVEDIIDTGNTIENIVNTLEKTGVSNYKIASLFLKPEVYKKPYKIDYLGMEIPNKFIVGYGLDYNGLGRNLPEVFQLKNKIK